MKKYKIRVLETLETEIEIEAESMKEAEDKVAEGWFSDEYLHEPQLTADTNFIAEDMTPKKLMQYDELSNLFFDLNEKGLPSATGYIVFSTDSFDEPFNEESRTYAISSSNSAFRIDVKECSLFGSCLDGTDQNLRLDNYLKVSGGWKIEKCYMLKDEYDRLQTELVPQKTHEPRLPER